MPVLNWVNTLNRVPSNIANAGGGFVSDTRNANPYCHSLTVSGFEHLCSCIKQNERTNGSCP